MDGTYLASVKWVQNQRCFAAFPEDPTEDNTQWSQYSHAPATRPPGVDLQLLSGLLARMYDAGHEVTVFFQLRRDTALTLSPGIAQAHIQIRLSSSVSPERLKTTLEQVRHPAQTTRHE
ncbi:hypothetical protein D3C78_1575670 [compost metagenome]